jgi:2-phospho-L-lactate guanylyltransferase
VSSDRATTATIGAMTSESPGTAGLPWHLVVPVKGGTAAKSRLHPPAGVGREDLALALATDCLTACCAALPPARVVVVTCDPRVRRVATALGTVVVPDPGRGLDAAARAGRDHVTTSSPASPVGVLLGDLPALRPEDLAVALDTASAHRLAVVPDASGHGTVLLTARDAAALVPAFGAGSAHRHELARHTRLDLDLPRLRTDVDEDVDLATAARLGLGPATSAVLEAAPRARDTLPDMQGSVHTFDEGSGSGSVLLDDGREVRFSGEVFGASALRHLRAGQRLSLDLAAGGGSVERLWIVGIGDDQPIG